MYNSNKQSYHNIYNITLAILFFILNNNQYLLNKLEQYFTHINVCPQCIYLHNIVIYSNLRFGQHQPVQCYRYIPNDDHNYACLYQCNHIKIKILKCDLTKKNKNTM